MHKILEAYQSPITPDMPPIGEVRRQLARIVGSTVLRNSLRLTHFLTFIVETTLAGDSDQIKAYTVAVGALARQRFRSPDRSDRARRSRAAAQALSRYYAGAGGTMRWGSSCHAADMCLHSAARRPWPPRQPLRCNRRGRAHLP